MQQFLVCETAAPIMRMLSAAEPAAPALATTIRGLGSDAEAAVDDGRLREGMMLYTRAIETLSAALDEDGPASPRTAAITGLHSPDEGDAVTMLAQLLYRRARARAKMRDFRTCIHDLDAAIAIRAASRLYLLKGTVLMQLHEFAEASSTLLEGIKYAPSDQAVKKEFDKCLCLLREQWQAYRRARPESDAATPGVHGPAREYDVGATPNVLPNFLSVAPQAARAAATNSHEQTYQQCLAQEHALLRIDDLLAHEIQFWRTNGLELNVEELRAEFHALLRDVKPVLSALFVKYCNLSNVSTANAATNAQNAHVPTEKLSRSPRRAKATTYTSIVMDRPNQSKNSLFEPIAVRRCMSGRRLLEMMRETRVLDGQVEYGYAHATSVLRYVTSSDRVSNTPPPVFDKSRVTPREALMHADEVAPGGGNGLLFPQFMEAVVRVALGRYSAQVPKELHEEMERQAQQQADWIKQQAEHHKAVVALTEGLVHDADGEADGETGGAPPLEPSAPRHVPKPPQTGTSSTRQLYKTRRDDQQSRWDEQDEAADDNDSDGIIHRSSTDSNNSGIVGRPTAVRRGTKALGRGGRRESTAGTRTQTTRPIRGQRRATAAANTSLGSRPPSANSESSDDRKLTPGGFRGRASVRHNADFAQGRKRNTLAQRGAVPASSGADSPDATTQDKQERSRKATSRRTSLATGSVPPGAPIAHDGVFISRIGGPPPDKQGKRMTLAQTRGQMRIALLTDRLRYAIKHHMLRNEHCGADSNSTAAPNEPCDEFVNKYKVWLRKVFTHYAISDEARQSMGIFELLHAASELKLIADESQLSSFVRTAVAVVSFIGVPTMDQLGVIEFVEVIFHFAEERTHDGLCSSLSRVENFMATKLFPAVREKGEISLLA